MGKQPNMEACFMELDNPPDDQVMMPSACVCFRGTLFNLLVSTSGDVFAYAPPVRGRPKPVWMLCIELPEEMSQPINHEVTSGAGETRL
ncbi:hypothetical protein [Rubellicoccus peritrichatus]|uniref:Uncharacterized protein n=1 Tax=Rubellicoccus peritrichatus TaxID=3080537 RepID=A0AAQ3L998_9BACT|nr:hypothetical protein [Puniceicoccus sp. CR14]WOO39655.1 hypothetical protein RZN69_13610 [Puniceicoccus sp. CR14]